ncbi:glycine cleavage system H protein, mitochondrial [Pieris rapae]|uniref:glycine cleavage system H protein, mitochondrial n=1 Tax=Pieris rapae TaxID=64459 RepID=UPI001E27AAA0|nr:glycine cleavage system H protein, mitochondrial [Pieris rapae]XP_022118250.2 glycine cleavage system H protein, mitochondrial [Pieris rapae]XP_022118251.2 glycine cleavage system H protein, mitochondrial [Pieris rapae]XP_022118252.2 glycine cleavage system H protein, mitochondrial [Pieris rapae]XP_022118253.2 glycine cleavage system H protein, mitochondrial [Pieris rapae]
MTLQRCLYQVSKQLISQRFIPQPSVRQVFCKISSCKYSTNAEKKYSDRHEWVLVDKENIGTVGISKYAQESLGDVVFAQLPDPGMQLNAGDECGALESVKAASEIYSPVSGTVTEKNKEVEKKPGLINSSYYDKGWLFKLKLSKPEQLNNLMTEKQYEEFLKTDVDKDHT